MSCKVYSTQFYVRVRTYDALAHLSINCHSQFYHNQFLYFVQAPVKISKYDTVSARFAVIGHMSCPVRCSMYILWVCVSNIRIAIMITNICLQKRTPSVSQQQQQLNEQYKQRNIYMYVN